MLFSTSVDSGGSAVAGPDVDVVAEMNDDPLKKCHLLLVMLAAAGSPLTVIGPRTE